jgi:hypothetical protein
MKNSQNKKTNLILMRESLSSVRNLQMLKWMEGRYCILIRLLSQCGVTLQRLGKIRLTEYLLSNQIESLETLPYMELSLKEKGCSHFINVIQQT